MEPFEEKNIQAAPELTAQAAEQTSELPQAADVPAVEAQTASAAAETPETAEQPESEAEQPSAEPGRAAEASGKEQSFLGDLMDLMESVIASIFVVMLVFAYLFCTADVEGSSMEPTLEENNRLLVNRIDKNYHCGEILIIDCDGANLLDENGELKKQQGLEKRIVKRLIAQGGQQVDINFDKGVVIVDGEELIEPYVSTLTTRDNHAFTYPVTVPEGYVFVLGDNRYVSKDSRSSEIGFVPAENIVGKVILRISPLSSFGKVD